jgi:hypothetical protein
MKNLRKSIHLLFVISIITSLFSCSPQRFTYKSNTSRISEPPYSGYVVPWIADIQLVSPDKITYSEVFDIVVDEFTTESNIEMYKTYTLGIAAKKNNADIIIAPLYEIETTDKGFLRITVSGYLGKFVNFRSATKDDQWFINLYKTTTR